MNELIENPVHVYPDGKQVLIDTDTTELDLSPDFEIQDSSGEVKQVKNRNTIYYLSELGLYLNSNRQKVSSTIWIDKLTKNIDTQDFGVHIGFIDIQGAVNYFSCAAGDIDTGLIPKLKNKGVIVQPKMGSDVLDFLVPDPANSSVILEIDKTGWVNLPSKQLSFVLPEQSIGSGGDIICYQPSGTTASLNSLKVQGDLKSWNEGVAVHCNNNPYLVFLLGVSFSSVLLKLLGQDGGGFHLYGLTSQGKTTAMQVAASVWGNGVDPAVDANHSYIQRWNMTGNGLEALALSFNDLPLILDELGTSGVADPAKAVYDLAGGKGKSAMNRNRELVHPRTWRVVLLSTGEYSIKTEIENKSGSNSLKGGQQIRLIDLPISDAGIFETTQDITPAEFAKNLKANCSEFYGIAGREFITFLTNKVQNDSSYLSTLISRFKGICNTYNSDTSKPEQARAAQRFAVAELAGTIASEANIVDIQAEQFKSASHQMFSTWLNNTELLSDVDRAIERLKNFIIEKPYLLYSNTNLDSPNREISGYKHDADQVYLILPNVFQRVIGNVCYKAVAKKLRDLGLLKQNNGSHLKSGYTISHLGKRLQFFAIRYSLLEANSPTTV